MIVGVFEGERSVTDLTTKYFGPLRKADKIRVDAALLRANPQLKNIANVRKGSPVVIPAIVGFVPKGARQDPAGVYSVVLAVRDAVKQFESDVAETAKGQKAEDQKVLRRLATLLRSRNLAAHVKRVEKATNDRLAERDAKVRRTREVAKQIDKDLEALTSRLSV